MPVGGPRVKGTAIRSTSEFLNKRFGPDTMSQIVETLPPDLQTFWPNILPSMWYPAPALWTIWSECVRMKLAGEGHAEQTRFFSDVGRYIAEDNLTTVYRFLLSVLSPDRMLGAMPRLWGTYFQGVNVHVKPVSGKKEGIVSVFGLGASYYLSPAAAGWIELAYEKCGASVVEVTEQSWQAGKTAADPYVFRQRWG